MVEIEGTRGRAARDERTGGGGGKGGREKNTSVCNMFLLTGGNCNIVAVTWPVAGATTTINDSNDVVMNSTSIGSSN